MLCCLLTSYNISQILERKQQHSIPDSISKYVSCKTFFFHCKMTNEVLTGSAKMQVKVVNIVEFLILNIFTLALLPLDIYDLGEKDN